MPILSSHFAIFTAGAHLNFSVEVPEELSFGVSMLDPQLVPGPGDDLFGPHARAFSGFRPTRAWLISMSREVKGRAGPFFDETRRLLLDLTRGLEGVGLDVLRLWPFPLAHAEDLIPDEILSEDLFSMGLTEMGEHGFRAETFGLAKLGQAELSFEFRGRELLEEAALMCGHLADWLMDHGRRVEDSQSMAFGYDRLTFFAADAGGDPRTWHPPLIQRLLPTSVFPGVGALEVLSHPEGAAPQDTSDLTIPLARSLEQRLVLEDLDVSGDSPHALATAQVVGTIDELRNLTMWREEHTGSKDSGWRFRRDGTAGSPETMALLDIARHVPLIVRFLALPWGVNLHWTAEGQLTIDTSKARHDDDDADEADD